jgi:hypothetical protein
VDIRCPLRSAVSRITPYGQIATPDRSGLTVRQRPFTFTGDPNAVDAAGAAIVSKYKGDFLAEELQSSSPTGASEHDLGTSGCYHYRMVPLGDCRVTSGRGCELPRTTAGWEAAENVCHSGDSTLPITALGRGKDH